jgi:hypothetical protein
LSADDDADCVEHVWGLSGLHLSLERGAEQEEACDRCGALRYVTDQARKNRPKLRPV